MSESYSQAVMRQHLKEMTSQMEKTLEEFPTLAPFLRRYIRLSHKNLTMFLHEIKKNQKENKEEEENEQLEDVDLNFFIKSILSESLHCEPAKVEGTVRELISELVGKVEKENSV